MALAGTIFTGIVLVLGLLNGLRRGVLKEGMVLPAVLLGVVLVTLWSERGGAVVARGMSWQPGTGQWLAAMSLLWGSTLGAGYASGALLPRRSGKISVPLRAAGGVLGVLNAGLLLAWSLRYTQHMFYGDVAGRKLTWIRLSVATHFLLEHLDVLMLGLAWSVAVVSLVVIVSQLMMRLISPARGVGRLPTQAEAAPARPILDPQSTAREPAPAPIPPGMERSFIEKSRTSTGGDRPGHL